MLLSGKRATSEADIAAFLGVCRVKGPRTGTGCWRCAGSRTLQGWFQQHGSRLPQQLITLIDHENKAVTISDFQPMVVPGLLQTAEYARALIQETVNVPPGGVTVGWPGSWLGRACSVGTARQPSPTTCTSSRCGCLSAGRW